LAQKEIDKEARGTSLYSDQSPKEERAKEAITPAYIGRELSLRPPTEKNVLRDNAWFEAILYIGLLLVTSSEYTSSYMTELSQNESTITNSLGCRLTWLTVASIFEIDCREGANGLGIDVVRQLVKY
jgi:hypothetical protein